MSKVRIVVDPTGINTLVEVDGETLDGVKAVSWSQTAGEAPEVTLTLDGLDVDASELEALRIHLDAEPAKPAKPEIVLELSKVSERVLSDAMLKVVERRARDLGGVFRAGGVIRA